MPLQRILCQAIPRDVHEGDFSSLLGNTLGKGCVDEAGEPDPPLRWESPLDGKGVEPQPQKNPCKSQ